MLDADTKRRIDTARDILVGKVPDPKSQVEQITIALIYKFMDDMDALSEELGGERSFFAGEFGRYGWAKLMQPGLGGHEMLGLYAEAIERMDQNAGIPQLFRDIFSNAFLPYRDPETLRVFLKEIDGFTYDNSERLGDAFEYLLSVMDSQGDAGQFRTPRHIIDFIVSIVDPKKEDVVLDPACGTAGFLISSYKHIVAANTDADGNSTLDARRPGTAGKEPDGLRHLAGHGAAVTGEYVFARACRSSHLRVRHADQRGALERVCRCDPGQPALSCRRKGGSGRTTGFRYNPSAARFCSWTTWPSI